jgi:hypothetical protein
MQVPLPPIFIGPPDPIPQEDTLVEVIQDATWVALGKPKPDRVYCSIQGDWWDLIAIRVYGAQRGNEHLMFRLLEENWPLREVAQFPAGLAVIVPEVDIETDIQLVPWKKAARVPNS